MKKHLAGTVACLYFFTQVLAAHAAEANFWTERRTSLQQNRPARAPAASESLRMAKLSMPSLENPLPTVGGSISAFGSTLPKENADWRSGASPRSWLAPLVAPHGWVRKTHTARRGAPFVVLIQDLHGLESAQRRTAALIESLRAEKGVELVALEGAGGGFDLSPYRSFDERAVRETAAGNFLREGYIGGAEYAGVVAEAPVRLWGAEDLTLYDENIGAAKASLARRAEAGRLVAAAHGAAAALKPRIYSKPLLAYDAAVERYHARQLPLGDYVDTLAQAQGGVDARRFPNLAILAEAFTLEMALDFKKVERERTNLMESLVKTLPRPALETLVNRSLAYRQGQLSYGAYYDYLSYLCGQNNLSMGRYPSLTKYIHYIGKADGIKREELLIEISDFEAQAGRSLAATPAQTALVALSADIRLLGKLTLNQMTPADWTAYAARRTAILALPERLGKIGGAAVAGWKEAATVLKPFEDFCRLAVERNEALAGNLAAKMTADKTEAAVLVAGGFHSDGLAEALTRRGVSWAIVTPKIDDLPAEKDTLDVFARDPLPLEKVFAGEPISLIEPRLLADNGPQKTPAQSVKNALVGTLLGIFIESRTRAHAPAAVLAAAQAQVARVGRGLRLFNSLRLAPTRFFVYGLQQNRWTMATVGAGASGRGVTFHEPPLATAPGLINAADRLRLRGTYAQGRRFFARWGIRAAPDFLIEILYSPFKEYGLFLRYGLFFHRLHDNPDAWTLRWRQAGDILRVAVALAGFWLTWTQAASYFEPLGAAGGIIAVALAAATGILSPIPTQMGENLLANLINLILAGVERLLGRPLPRIPRETIEDDPADRIPAISRESNTLRFFRSGSAIATPIRRLVDDTPGFQFNFPAAASIARAPVWESIAAPFAIHQFVDRPANVVSRFPEDITFSFEIEFKTEEQVTEEDLRQAFARDPLTEEEQRRWRENRVLPHPKWMVLRDRVRARVEAALPPGWELDPIESEIRTRNAGGVYHRNTDGDWADLLAGLEALQRALPGGAYSVHMHVGHRRLARNGRLNVQRPRFLRLVKVFEAQWRALAGLGYSAPGEGTVHAHGDTVVGNDEDLAQMAAHSHMAMWNLSGLYPTMELKFLHGLLSPSGHIDAAALRENIQWAFVFLERLADPVDGMPLAVMGLPAVAGTKPTRKQTDRFLDLVFAGNPDARERARQRFEALAGEPAGLPAEEIWARMDRLRAVYQALGLGIVFQRHADHDGWDEDLFLHLTDATVLDQLADDLVRAHAADNDALGFFPAAFHERLRPALERARKRMPPGAETKTPPELLPWLENFNPSPLSTLLFASAMIFPGRAAPRGRAWGLEPLIAVIIGLALTAGGFVPFVSPPVFLVFVLGLFWTAVLSWAHRWVNTIYVNGPFGDSPAFREMSDEGLAARVAFLFGAGRRDSPPAPVIVERIVEVPRGNLAEALGGEPGPDALERFDNGYWHDAESGVLYIQRRPFGLLRLLPAALPAHGNSTLYDPVMDRIFVTRAAARKSDFTLGFLLAHERGKRFFFSHSFLIRRFGQNTAERMGDLFEAGYLIGWLARKSGLTETSAYRSVATVVLPGILGPLSAAAAVGLFLLRAGWERYYAFIASPEDTRRAGRRFFGRFGLAPSDATLSLTFALFYELPGFLASLLLGGVPFWKRHRFQTAPEKILGALGVGLMVASVAATLYFGPEIVSAWTGPPLSWPTALGIHVAALIPAPMLAHLAWNVMAFAVNSVGRRVGLWEKDVVPYLTLNDSDHRLEERIREKAVQYVPYARASGDLDASLSDLAALVKNGAVSGDIAVMNQFLRERHPDLAIFDTNEGFAQSAQQALQAHLEKHPLPAGLTQQEAAAESQRRLIQMLNGIVFDHHVPFYDPSLPETNSAMLLLDYIEQTLAAHGGDAAGAEKELIKKFRRVSTDNVGDGVLALWMARHLPLLVRDVEFRALMRDVAWIEDYGNFGTRLRQRVRGPEGRRWRRARTREYAVLKIYDDALARIGARGSDRFAALPTLKKDWEAQARWMNDLLQEMTGALIKEDRAGAREFEKRLIRARKRWSRALWKKERLAAALNGAAPGALLQQTTVFDGTVGSAEGGVFENFIAPTEVSELPFQIITWPASDGTRNMFIMAIRNGVPADLVDNDLTNVLPFIESAERAKSEPVPGREPGLLIARPFVLAAFTWPLLQTAEELLRAVNRYGQPPAKNPARSVPRPTPSGTIAAQSPEQPTLTGASGAAPDAAGPDQETRHFKALRLRGERSAVRIRIETRGRAKTARAVNVHGAPPDFIRMVPSERRALMDALQLGEDEFGALLKEALDRSGVDPSALPTPSLLIALLERENSKYLFEDHKQNSFIGVNKTFLDMAYADPLAARALFVLGLAHELRHEAGIDEEDPRVHAQEAVRLIADGVVPGLTAMAFAEALLWEEKLDAGRLARAVLLAAGLGKTTRVADASGLGLYTVDDHDPSEEREIRNVLRFLRRGGLLVATDRSLEYDKPLQYFLWELLRASRGGPLTLILTGGLLPACILAAFSIAASRTLFEHGRAIHIVLPASTLYSNWGNFKQLEAEIFLLAAQRLDVPVTLSLDGETVFDQKGRAAGPALAVSVYSTTGDFARRFPEEFERIRAWLTANSASEPATRLGKLAALEAASLLTQRYDLYYDWAWMEKLTVETRALGSLFAEKFPALNHVARHLEHPRDRAAAAALDLDWIGRIPGMPTDPLSTLANSRLLTLSLSDWRQSLDRATRLVAQPALARVEQTQLGKDFQMLRTLLVMHDLAAESGAPLVTLPSETLRARAAEAALAAPEAPPTADADRDPLPFKALRLRGERTDVDVDEEMKARPEADRKAVPLPDAGGLPPDFITMVPAEREALQRALKVNEAGFAALLKEALVRSEVNPAVFKDKSLLLALLARENSKHLFEDHEGNGFIGVNGALLDVAAIDPAAARALFVAGLAHELNHEAGNRAEDRPADVRRLAAMLEEDGAAKGLRVTSFITTLLEADVLADTEILYDVAAFFAGSLASGSYWQRVPEHSGRMDKSWDYRDAAPPGAIGFHTVDDHSISEEIQIRALIRFIKDLDLPLQTSKDTSGYGVERLVESLVRAAAGGLLNHCIRAAFSLAVSRTLMKHGNPLHIVLPMEALYVMKGQRKQPYLKAYMELAKYLHMPVNVYVDGVPMWSWDGDGKTPALVITIYSKSGHFRRNFPGHIARVREELARSGASTGPRDDETALALGRFLEVQYARLADIAKLERLIGKARSIAPKLQLLLPRIADTARGQEDREAPDSTYFDMFKNLHPYLLPNPGSVLEAPHVALDFSLWELGIDSAAWILRKPTMSDHDQRFLREIVVNRLNKLMEAHAALTGVPAAPLFAPPVEVPTPGASGLAAMVLRALHMPRTFTNLAWIDILLSFALAAIWPFLGAWARGTDLLLFNVALPMFSPLGAWTLALALPLGLFFLHFLTGVVRPDGRLRGLWNTRKGEMAGLAAAATVTAVGQPVVFILLAVAAATANAYVFLIVLLIAGILHLRTADRLDEAAASRESQEGVPPAAAAPASRTDDVPPSAAAAVPEEVKTAIDETVRRIFDYPYRENSWVAFRTERIEDLFYAHFPGARFLTKDYQHAHSPISKFMEDHGRSPEALREAFYRFWEIYAKYRPAVDEVNRRLTDKLRWTNMQLDGIIFSYGGFDGPLRYNRPRVEGEPRDVVLNIQYLFPRERDVFGVPEVAHEAGHGLTRFMENVQAPEHMEESIEMAANWAAAHLLSRMERWDLAAGIARSQRVTLRGQVYVHTASHLIPFAWRQGDLASVLELLRSANWNLIWDYDAYYSRLRWRREDLASLYVPRLAFYGVLALAALGGTLYAVPLDLGSLAALGVNTFDGNTLGAPLLLAIGRAGRYAPVAPAVEIAEDRYVLRQTGADARLEPAWRAALRDSFWGGAAQGHLSQRLDVSLRRVTVNVPRQSDGLPDAAALRTALAAPADADPFREILAREAQKRLETVSSPGPWNGAALRRFEDDMNAVVAAAQMEEIFIQLIRLGTDGRVWLELPESLEGEPHASHRPALAAALRAFLRASEAGSNVRLTLVSRGPVARAALYRRIGLTPAEAAALERSARLDALAASGVHGGISDKGMAVSVLRDHQGLQAAPLILGSPASFDTEGAEDAEIIPIFDLAESLGRALRELRLFAIHA